MLCIGTLCLQLALKYPIYHRCIVISFIAEGKPPWPVYTHSPIYGHQTTSQRHNDTKRERERELDLKEKLALPSTNEKNQRVMHCQRIDQTDCHVT